MSYILILTPNALSTWPAVIGGYATREAADSAGREATCADLNDEIKADHDGFAPCGNPRFAPWFGRSWTKFTVIPGNIAG